mgnify:CR=1 FL=1
MKAATQEVTIVKVSMKMKPGRVGVEVAVRAVVAVVVVIVVTAVEVEVVAVGPVGLVGLVDLAEVGVGAVA